MLKNISIINKIVSLFGISFVYLLLVSPAMSLELPAPVKISKHVYAWIGPLEGPSFDNQGYRMNMTFVVGKKSIAVIDTGYTPMMAKQMLAHIKKVSSLPVRYAINTSSQPHRYMGNDVFSKAGAKIIAHQVSVNRMEQRGDSFVSTIERLLKLKKNTFTHPRLPDNIITKDFIADLGGVKINIMSFGATHTPAQLVVEIPDDKVICSGDVLYSGRLLAILQKSNVLSWIRAYDRLRTYKDYTFIPGHGQPARLSAFEFPTYSYLTRIYAHMKKAVDEFVDLQDAINSFDQRDYQQLVNFSQLAGRNASWTYLSLEAQGVD